MILVTGATGRLGGNVVRLLRQARAEVRCLVRMGSQYFWLNDTGAAYFFADLREPHSLVRAIKDVTHVIHAAGIGLETSDNHHANTVLQGTCDLVDAAVEGGVQHFVMASCLAVGRGYPVSAFDCLEKAEKHLQDSALSHTILRCAPFAERFSDAARQIAEGQGAQLWGSGEGLLNPLSRRDAALYAMACLDPPAAKDTTLEIGGPDACTAAEAMSLACERAQVDPALLRRPGAWERRVQRRTKSLVLGRRWSNYMDREGIFDSEDFTVDATSLQAQFGIQLTSLVDAIDQGLAEEHPSLDPTARDERVVHRQFQATVYKPGETPADELPTGPRRY